MRTKHPGKESGGLYPGGCSDPLLAPFGELRKNEGRYVSARGKSKCASVRENSRSGGTTPRESPSPKCDRLVKEVDGETPRTYLIKDSFREQDIKLAELMKPASNKFLSEIDESRVMGGGASCPSSSAADEEINMRELIKQLKGKSHVHEKVAGRKLWLDVEDEDGDRRGRAPLAFLTEEEMPRGTSADASSAGFDETQMPPWLQDACRSLTCLDDEEMIPRGDSGASCSRNDQSSGDDEGCFEGGVVRGSRSRSSSGSRSRAGEVVELEREQEQEQGTGWLWKMSLCASVSFVTWVLMNGARIQCRSLLPTIREREQPLKIVRPNKPSTSGSSSSSKPSIAEEQKFC